MAPSALHRRPNAFTVFVTLVIVALNSWITVSNAASLKHQNLHSRAQFANGVELRVLPIGDSITFGSGSSDWNGYRKMLYNDLAKLGNKLDFVGGVPQDGDMEDGDSEGHRGFVIDEIAGSSGIGMAAAPNIVLLHAGTNDMNKDNIDYRNAPNRLKKLMEKIWDYSPDALILVAKIIMSKTAQTQYRIEDFNHEIPEMVKSFKDKKVAIVEMDTLLDRWDMKDNLHPADKGFRKMADAWYAAILDAEKQGLITKPGKASTPPDQTSVAGCKSTPSWYNVGEIASGAKVASGDGDFQQSWNKIGVVADGACSRSLLHFMDLDGDGLKDYACVDPKTGAVTVHINVPDSNGKAQNVWKPARKIATGQDGRSGTGVMFADLNGDGRDDYIYVDPKDGDVYGWINRGDKDGTWQWQPLDKIAGGVGATNETLQMVDIDGDGRDDFFIVNPKSGEVTAWLNTGAGMMPDYHKIGVIATGSSASSSDTVILGDFTGNGRADYMIVGSGGKVTGLANRLQEESLIPRWMARVTLADGPSGAKQDQVRLVDFTGDGKVDYLLVDSKGKVTLWENTGSGGKYQPGEGVILCDLNGDGAMDYFWVDDTGKGYGYLNAGKGTNNWNDLGLIAKGNHKRELVRMGVLTKSKRADYIVLDKDTGRANWYKNLGSSGGWGWGAPQEVATGPVKTLKDRFGITFKAKNVRFADLNNDDLDDYVYVDDGGATIMWPNSGADPPSFNTAVKVADGPGVLAQEVQFADTNGDGKLDYVVVSRITGRTRSWHHLGFLEGGSIRWNTPLNFADGPGPTGYNVRIAEMTGDKRADYVAINPDNGRLRLWHNRCWQRDYEWETVGCTDPAIEKGPEHAKDRWKAVGADNGFESMISSWKKEKSQPTHLKFAPACAHYWNLQDNMNCHVRASENGCNNYAQCQDTNRPAGWLIMNSFVSINDLLANMYDAMGRVHTSMQSELSAIGEIFQEKPPKDPDVALMLEIVSLVFAVAGAPIWNSVLRKTGYFALNPNTLGVLKDGVNGAVANGLTIAKGRLAKEATLESGSALGISLSDAVNSYYESISDLQAFIFGGTEEAVAVLRNLMTDGLLNGAEFEPESDKEIRKTLSKSLYSVIIPQTWFLSEEPVSPGIIKTTEKCSKDTSPPKDWVATCIDGVFFRLIAAMGPGESCSEKPCPKPPIPCTKEETCVDRKFSEPPGLDVLDGTAYGGLTHHNIIRAAVNTWKSSGKDNDGNSMNNHGLLDPMVDNFDFTALNIESPGLVTIPVCDEADLRTTWRVGRKESMVNYPCPN